jgi:SPP1 family holin
MDKMMLIRTLILVLALVNQVLVSFGMSPLPIDEQNVELVVSLVWTGVASILTWWKDNDITKKARDNKQVLKDMGLK